MSSDRLHKPLVEWAAADIEALVEERIDEGQRLEYKRELNLDTREQRLEAAKDASGMANAVGGLIIYGVEEEELKDGRRVPVRTVPLTSGDAQARLEDVLGSAISPRLSFSARTLETEGGYFVLIQVEQRSGPLHMVEAYGQNRYFVRTGLSTRPMQSHEVERVFRELRESESRIEELVQGLPLVARLDPRRTRHADLNESAQRNQRIEPMAEPWVSVVTAPFDATGPLLPMRPASPLDFNLLERQASMIGNWEAIGGTSFRIDAHGYVLQVPGGPGTLIQLRLFREGVFEWGTRWQGRGGGRPIAMHTFAKNVHDALVYFASVYREVGYYGRLRVWVRIENADLSEFAGERDLVLRSNPTPPTRESLSFVAETSVEELLSDPMSLVHAAMDFIWQGYGLDRCHLFTAEGKLVA